MLTDFAKLAFSPMLRIIFVKMHQGAFAIPDSSLLPKNVCKADTKKVGEGGIKSCRQRMCNWQIISENSESANLRTYKTC